jgi:CRP-like cAMP-binding protein
LQLKKISVPKQFFAKDYICHEGQPGNEMYIILKGSVGIYITSVIGTLTRVATIKEGDFFGEMAIFDNLPRSASCIALEDTIAVAVTKDNLQEFLETCPEIAGQMLENMSGRIRKLDMELYQNNRFVKNRHVPKFEIPTIYTSGHVVKTPYQDAQLINEYKQKCPICGKAITVKELKRNILEEKSFEADCRIIYLGCDPLWTEVISCPHCYYTNHYLKFFGINNFEFEIIEKLLYNEHKPVVEDRLEKRGDFDIMVMKYLQAININEHINPGANALIGSLWRNLYWMSKDVSDTAFAAYCVKKAMEKLKIAIDGNEFHDAESKTTTALSLAAMMINNGERKEIKHYITIAAESPNERIRGRALQIMARMEQKKN